MGGSPQTIEKTQTQEAQKGPNAMQAPFYADLYSKAQTALNATNNNPFGGDFIAQPTASDAAGVNLLKNNTSVGAGSQDFLNMAVKTAQGGYLDPASNPFIGSVANAAIQPLQQNLTTNLGNIKDAAIAGGAYGGARQDLSEERALNDFTRSAGDITSNIFYNNYVKERDNQINSANLLGQGYDLTNASAKQALNAGQTERSMTQLGLDNALQKYTANQSAPWYGLGEMSQILASGGFNSSTGTVHSTEDNPNYVDPFTQALKIAIGGASTVATAGGSGGFGFWGPKAAGA